MSEIVIAPSGRSTASARNSCKLCAPLGASVAFRGIEGCVPLVHGSQGCSTYVRRYVISHFREPMDVASSNFTESAAVFGGRESLIEALANVERQYAPSSIGVASTCLTETIGDDVPAYLRSYAAERPGGIPVFFASTPSYRGTHVDGFHRAVFAAVSALTSGPATTRAGDAARRVNLVSGFVSAEDLRELREILSSFGAPFTLVPDYSESLDGPSWSEYQRLPAGGTPLADIARMPEAAGTVCLGVAVSQADDVGLWLAERYGVPSDRLYLPVGIELTDRFFAALERITGVPTPPRWISARGRLVDAYADGHKYCAGKRAIVFGDEDLVCSLASFLDEIGISVAIAATGAPSPAFAERLKAVTPNARAETLVLEDADFETILERAQAQPVDILVGNSKGLRLSRALSVPLVRCGFPIHDRMGAQRVLHLGYRGTVNLLDLVCNALMEARQREARSGYTYV